MSSFMEMSLEEIIKKKKRDNIRSKPPINKKQNKPTMKPNPNAKVPITDARNKIILNKRKQISDAREKLAELAKQKDARLKLDQLRKQRAQNPGRKYPTSRPKPVRTLSYRDRVFMDASRQVVSQPLRNSRAPRQQINARKFLENRFIEKRPNVNNRSSRIAPRSITRTVENDLEILDDPMGDDEVYVTPKKSALRQANLQLKIVARNDGIRGGHSITVHRPILEREKSPPRPPSILKKRPMAALRTEKKPEIDKVALEFRIIVSNLKSSVTGGDIEELFGDVGGMVESRLVRPGTAEVIYKTLEDAQRAVDLYHNRQLDGQPMNCLLVTPRPNAVPSRSSIAPALYSTNSNVEPDISTFHKVLFNQF